MSSSCACSMAVVTSKLSSAADARRGDEPPRCRIRNRFRATASGRCWDTGRIFPSLYEFTRREEEPEPQSFGSRFGPPHKHIAAGLLDSPQFPRIRPRCFGCSQPLAVAEIGRHILSCDKVLVRDLARFETALAEFTLNPSRAREVVEAFVNRVRLSCGLDVDDRSL